MLLLQSKISSLVLMQRLVQVFNLKMLISNSWVIRSGGGSAPFKARSNMEVHFPTW